MENIFMYFISAMKKYVVFKGRARRAEYWSYVLCTVLISIIVSIIDVKIFGYSIYSDENSLLSNIVSLVFFLPSLSISWRRMHDVGKSGAYTFIPIYNLILSLRQGETGPNEYGPDPKESQEFT